MGAEGLRVVWHFHTHWQHLRDLNSFVINTYANLKLRWIYPIWQKTSYKWRDFYTILVKQESKRNFNAVGSFFSLLPQYKLPSSNKTSLIFKMVWENADPNWALGCDVIRFWLHFKTLKMWDEFHISCIVNFHAWFGLFTG